MATSNLTPGDHTVVYTKDGYSDLTIQFNVSNTGVVTCQLVSGGSCNSSTSPGCTIFGRTLTGYIKEKVVEMKEFKIISVTTDKTSYKPNEIIGVTVVVKNTGNVSARPYIMTTVQGNLDGKAHTGDISIGATWSATMNYDPAEIERDWTPGVAAIEATVKPWGEPITDTKTISVTIIAVTHTITFTSVPAGATIRVDGTLI